MVERLDDLFSEYIRKRAIKRVGGCERCGAHKGDIKGLDAAHLHSRGKYTVRWDERNAVGLCGGCHLYLDSHLDAKSEFARHLLGREEYQRLYTLANMTTKQSPVDFPMVEIYLKALLEEVQ